MKGRATVRLRPIIGNPLLDRRRKRRALADRNARNRPGHGRGQRFQARVRPARGGRPHARDERCSIREGQRSRARRVEVTAHHPRPLVMMGMRRQTTLGEGDAAAIEKLAARATGHGPDARSFLAEPAILSDARPE
jgi:hypothetical protein